MQILNSLHALQHCTWHDSFCVRGLVRPSLALVHQVHVSRPGAMSVSDSLCKLSAFACAAVLRFSHLRSGPCSMHYSEGGVRPFARMVTCSAPDLPLIAKPAQYDELHLAPSRVCCMHNIQTKASHTPRGSRATVTLSDVTSKCLCARALHALWVNHADLCGALTPEPYTGP